MTGALQGIRVVEIANWAAVPSTGVLLAEQGAEVIKVEPLGGDPMRGLMHQAGVPGASDIDHPFQFSNRHKKSVTIALDTDRGSALALNLVAEADVVITNLLPARRIRMGLTVEDFRRVNPTAIIGVLTGYGEEGQEADRPGFDLTAFFARSGLSAAIAGAEGGPPRWRPAQGDHVAGLSLYAGVLTALFERSSTGEGQVVETSLLRAASWTNAFDLTRAAADGRPARAHPRERSVNATVEAFECSDGRWVQLSLAEPERGWEVVCEMIGRDELRTDPRFATVRDRFVNMGELIPILSEEFATRTSAEVVDEITDRGGVCALVMTSEEVVAHPQTRAAGVLRSVRHRSGDFEVVAPPFGLRGEYADADAVPEPGADNHVVLHGVLGLSDDEIYALEVDGVIG